MCRTEHKGAANNSGLFENQLFCTQTQTGVSDSGNVSGVKGLKGLRDLLWELIK